MRILLDECVDESLRHHFGDYDCQTCRYAGLKGLANGQLLTAAEQAGFDVLITVDQNLPYQQRLAGRSIAVIVFQVRSTTIDELLLLVPDALGILKTIEAGEVVRIGVR
jgi:hypothetical protein